jgi:hypothetical protein
MVQGTDYRERVPMPGWVVPALGLLGGLWVARRVRGLRGHKPRWRKALSLMNAVSTAFMLLGAVRRFGYIAIEVEEQNIRLGLGPMEKRIPAQNVRDVRVAIYNPLRFLGWGYRLGFDGRRAFSQIGVPRGVEITADEDGRQRRYFVSSNEPEALASAVAAVAGVGSA